MMISNFRFSRFTKFISVFISFIFLFTQLELKSFANPIALPQLIPLQGATYTPYQSNRFADGIGQACGGPHAIASSSDGTIFSYDANGNMLQRNNSVTNKRANYEYDPQNRLIRVTNSTKLLPGQPKVPTLNIGPVTIQTNDNPKPANALSLANLKPIVLPKQKPDTYIVNSKTEFTYDPDGGRTEKAILSGIVSPVTREAQVQGKTTYVGSLYEIEITNPVRLNDPEASEKNTKYIFLGSERIASVATAEGGAVPETNFYHTDHLGSSNLITNQAGELQQYLEYQPFGTTAKSEGTNITKHKFTGKELDDSTGLYYYGARYYDSNICRFIQADTIVPNPSNPQTLNRYSYCLNNPLTYTDPTGHWSWKSFWNAFAGAFLGAAVTVLTAGAGAPLFLAGMVGGMLGGTLTGGLEGGGKGAAMGAGIGAVLGAFGGWGYEIGGLGFAIGMVAIGAGVAGATDSWDSFAGGVAGGVVGATVGNGIASMQQGQGSQTGNGLAENSKSIPQGRVGRGYFSEDNGTNFQARIDEGYKKLESTNWAKTDRGQKVVDSIGTAKNQNKIKIETLDINTRADFNPRTGEIRINSNIKQSYIPGRLAHEGTHLVQHREGLIYGFQSEREAFNNAFAVDSEFGLINAWNPSNLWIKKQYDFE